ncbi:uncharacterized protein LOC143258883 [Megalopta genalis]|uniref:uncharacterized protein LOC117228590 n=1 Tax=Megalopta genalis TaxID=115081 RepID=UPI003FCF7920
MENLTKKFIGCIEKCTSGLSSDELDTITDNIQRTLSHPKGIKIFEKFLEKSEYKNEIKCLDLYKICHGFIDKLEEEPQLEDLIDKVQEVLKMAEELEGVTEIDHAFMTSLVEAINDKSSSALLAVLKDTRERCQNHLRGIHDEFKIYASEPCPLGI